MPERRRRAYAPMTLEDVDYIYQKQKEFKGLMGMRMICIQLGDTLKAARCRIDAEAISRELYRKFDIIL